MLARPRADADGTPIAGIGAVRSVEPDERVDMVVAVQHELGAVPREHGAQRGGVGEPLEMADGALAGGWWISTTRNSLSRASCAQHLVQRAICSAPSRPVAINGARRDRGRKPDQRQRSAPAHEGKCRRVAAASSPRMKSPQCARERRAALRT